MAGEEEFDALRSSIAQHKIDFSRSFDHTLLRGRSVFLTGGASGLGEAFANALARAGAIVTVADINSENGMHVSQNLRAQGHDVHFVECDVSSWGSQLAAYKTALKHSGRDAVDLVVTCAGLGARRVELPVHEASEDDDPAAPADEQTLDVNMRGTYYSTKLALHYMSRYKARRQSGQANDSLEYSSAFPAVVLVGSVAGYRSITRSLEYSMSKFAVRGLFKSLRTSMIMINARINLLAPTWVATPMVAHRMAEIQALGVTLATVDGASNALMRVVCDKDINGRAVLVGGDANYDLRDDLEGYDGGEVMLDYYRRGHLPASQ